jgi:hypothetical protein
MTIARPIVSLTGKLSPKLMQSDGTDDGASGCANYHWQMEACLTSKKRML